MLKIGSETLAGIILLLPQEVLYNTVNRLKIQATNFNGNKIVLHGVILGLIALVKPHEVELVDWVIETLEYLAKYKNNYGIVSDSIRLCIAQFWNRHKPTWEYVKYKFTKEQQEVLEEHVNPYN